MSTVLIGTAMAATIGWGIVTQDLTPLRAAPKESSAQHAQLVQGELVEIRGERIDHLQVYEYRRERAGFVRASQVRKVAMTANEAPELLGLVRFLRDLPGSEGLGIAYVAAYLKVAPAAALQGQEGVEALDALGVMAERLANRASINGAANYAAASYSATGNGAISKPTQVLVSTQLEAVSSYGVQFKSYEFEGRMQVCYEGDAFRRVLSSKANAEQKARAALALTRSDCINPALRISERISLDQWRADVLEQPTSKGLPAYVANRFHMRRASVYSALAYQAARAEQLPQAQKYASMAQDDLARVNKLELPDEDLASHNDAVMRVNASRWAAVPSAAPSSSSPAGKPRLELQAQMDGLSCVSVMEGASSKALATRCSHGLVWMNSASFNREQNAAALAVQPSASWRELWVARKVAGDWRIDVLPPAPFTPETGYAEFAGWVPGGQQILVAREARGDGKYRRSYEVTHLDSLSPERQNSDPNQLGAFSRWVDPQWKRLSVSLR